MRPSVSTIDSLANEGKAWVKLSAPMIVSQSGASEYVDVALLVCGYLQLDPNRVVWGSDWQHLTMGMPPDDVAALHTFVRWCDADAGLQEKVFALNPARLYGFDA